MEERLLKRYSSTLLQEYVVNNEETQLAIRLEENTVAHTSKIDLFFEGMLLDKSTEIKNVEDIGWIDPDIEKSKGL